MNKKTKAITAIITIVFFINSSILPFQQAHAFNLFKEIGKGLKKTTQFIITLPDKITRPLGPVLGPVASFILTKNILKNPKFAKIFKTSRKISKVIQNIDDVNKQVGELKNAYKSEATKLRQKADALEIARKKLAGDLLEGKDLHEYMSQVADLQKIIEAHRDAATSLDKQAENMSTDKFIKLLGSKFVKNTLGSIKDAVLMDIAGDLMKTTDPNLIKTFVESNGSFENVLDYMVKRELYGQETKGSFNMEELKQRVKNTLKQKLEENKDYLKGNWKKEIKALIDKNYNEMKAESDAIVNKGEPYISKDGGATELDDTQKDSIAGFEENLEGLLGDFEEKDFGDCPSGYVFKRMSGVGCVQINCNEVHESAHWSYTQRCICGTVEGVEENPDDATKVCAFPPTYKPCPGCVYTCVHADEDCPLDGIAFQ